MRPPNLSMIVSRSVKIFLVLTLISADTHGFDILAPNWNRSACIQSISNRLCYGPSILQEYFAEPSTCAPNSTNYVLTVPGCRALCGEPSHTYWNTDAGVRLITWLLPILLMVVNVPLPDVGRGRFATVAILLGNPIQFNWGMVLEFETWMTSRKVARKVYLKKDIVMCLGRAIAIHQKLGKDPFVVDRPDEVQELWSRRLSKAVEEQGIETNDTWHEEGKECRKSTVRASITQAQRNQLRPSHLPSVDPENKLRKLDNELADFRRTEILRALLASTLYILLTLASFWPKLSDGSPASGGKIAPAALLAFLLFSVGLGNAVGDFQLAGCEKAFRRFFEDIGHPNEALLSNTYRGSHRETGCFQRLRTHTPSMKALPWAGGMPSYHAHSKVGTWPRLIARLVLSVIPLIIAFAAAMVALTTPPVYFSCRSKLIMGIFSLWLLSFFLNWILGWLHFASGKYLFQIIVLKDSMIAIVNLTFINLASAGWGNTCECWGGVTGKVQLNPVSAFGLNNEKRYPIAIGICFILQLLTLGLILLPNWRGYRMMWRKGASEDDLPRLFDV